MQVRHVMGSSAFPGAGSSAAWPKLIHPSHTIESHDDATHSRDKARAWIRFSPAHPRGASSDCNLLRNCEGADWIKRSLSSIAELWLRRSATLVTVSYSEPLALPAVAGSLEMIERTAFWDKQRFFQCPPNLDGMLQTSFSPSKFLFPARSASSGQGQAVRLSNNKLVRKRQSVIPDRSVGCFVKAWLLILVGVERGPHFRTARCRRIHFHWHLHVAASL